MTNIAIFASGSGTNAENIIKYFINSKLATVKLLLCDLPDAYVLERVKSFEVPAVVIDRREFRTSETDSQNIINRLKDEKIDLLILAGFLSKIPPYLTAAFPSKIINIHPALLPSYGGKGMYGSNVHKAVVANKEKESGITIHIIDDEYDKGNTLFQAKCQLTSDDTPDTLAEKIHILEQTYFPKVIENYIIMNDQKVLTEGVAYTSETIVSEINSAIALGSGNLPVFATPAMIALMENAAMNAVAPYVPEGSTTVGGSISSTHLRPSIYGKTVKATAVVEKVEGKKITFKISAQDDDQLIGEGSHIRFIVKNDFYKK